MRKKSVINKNFFSLTETKFKFAINLFLYMISILGFIFLIKHANSFSIQIYILGMILLLFNIIYKFIIYCVQKYNSIFSIRSTHSIHFCTITTIYPIAIILNTFLLLWWHRETNYIYLWAVISVLVWGFFLYGIRNRILFAMKKGLPLYELDTVAFFILFTTLLLINLFTGSLPILLVIIVYSIIFLLVSGFRSIDKISFWILLILGILMIIVISRIKLLFGIEGNIKTSIYYFNISFFLIEIGHLAQNGDLDIDSFIQLLVTFVFMMVLII